MRIKEHKWLMVTYIAGDRSVASILNLSAHCHVITNNRRRFSLSKLSVFLAKKF